MNSCIYLHVETLHVAPWSLEKIAEQFICNSVSHCTYIKNMLMRLKNSFWADSFLLYMYYHNLNRFLHVQCRCL